VQAVIRLTNGECGCINEETTMSAVKDEADETAIQAVGSRGADSADKVMSGAEQDGTTGVEEALNVAASIDEALASAAEGLRNVADAGIQPPETPKQRAAQASEGQAADAGGTLAPAARRRE
jgi:hypothetical protein